MKISRIPNFGSFGVYIDDVNMDHMTEQEWLDIGRLFVKELVVIFRNIKISKSQYLDWIPKWGPAKATYRSHLKNKYGRYIDAKDPSTWEGIDESDRIYFEGRQYLLEDSEDGRYLVRVYGGKDENGNMQGYFSNGEVFWHSNESSLLTFAPAVSLLGWEHMSGSATGFVQTVDLYENLPDSFRKELNDMVLIHQYIPGRMNENELTDESLALHLKVAFCPVDGVETPLVCTAPNGRQGLHYTVNSRAQIKGMSQEESNRLFEKLDKLVFDKKYIYDHYYDSNNTMCLFDNSVTLHHRLGGHPERKAFRQQFDLSPLLDAPWSPWQNSPEYHSRYIEESRALANALGGEFKDRFKLPNS